MSQVIKSCATLCRVKLYSSISMVAPSKIAQFSRYTSSDITTTYDIQNTFLKKISTTKYFQISPFVLGMYWIDIGSIRIS